MECFGCHPRIIHCGDDRGDAGSIPAELFNGAQLNSATRLAPELANASTGLSENNVGQFKELQTKPATDLDRPADP